MTTGYTAAVEDGKIGFEEFVWDCTRAFGVFIEQRDDPHGAKLRYPEPDGYYTERYDTAAKDLTEVLSRTDEEWVAEFKKDDELRRKSNEESRAKNAVTRANLTNVLVKVQNWQASEEHAGLKKFMLEQLTGSLDYCKDYDAPVNDTPFEERIQKEVEWATDNLKYAREDLKKRTASTAEARKWIDDLRTQIPVPRHLDGFTPNKKKA